MTSYLQIVTSLPFFRFMANLEQFGCRIPETWSVILVFSLTFYLTKTENRTKKSLTPLSYYCFQWRYILFLPKNVDYSKIKGSCYWKVYFLKLHMCVYFRTKLEISNLILTSFKQGVILSPPCPPQNKHLKSPPRLGLNWWHLNLNRPIPGKIYRKRSEICSEMLQFFSVICIFSIPNMWK